LLFLCNFSIYVVSSKIKVSLFPTAILLHFSSGKCQIAHWRQGHKDKCHPPSTASQIDDLVSDIRKKVAKPDRQGINDEKSQIESTEITKSSEKPPLSDIKRSPKSSCVKTDNARVESLAEENIADSNSELSCTSFSGFSASTGANGSSSSSDDSSVCESIISNEHERSEGPICTDHTFDVSNNTSNGHSIGATIPLSPKFASLVDSARPGIGKEEIKLTSSDSSGLMMRKGGTEPSKVSSGFWNGTLDSNGIKDDSFGDPLPSHSNESVTKSVGKNMPNIGLESSKNEGLDSTRYADASSIHNLHTVGSKVSNHVVINPGSNLRSAEISCLPCTSAENKLASRAVAEEHLHYSSKFTNNGTASGTANSSQVANCSPTSKDGLKTSVTKVVDQFRGSNMSKHFPIAVGSDAAVKYSDKVIF
jgi:ubiquitin carboxyl-terminal hydrolase 36/42